MYFIRFICLFSSNFVYNPYKDSDSPIKSPGIVRVERYIPIFIKYISFRGKRLSVSGVTLFTLSTAASKSGASIVHYPQQDAFLRLRRAFYPPIRLNEEPRGSVHDSAHRGNRVAFDEHYP